MLSAALDVNGMLWRTCPSATELELTVLDWMRRGLELPEDFFGFLTDTASISSMLALAAAREKADPQIRRLGMAGRDGPAVASTPRTRPTPRSPRRLLAIGLGLEGFRAVPHDADYGLDPEALARMVAEDRGAGFRPLAVVATVGTTSTTSVDPVATIAELCAAENMWLHVDAAYAGSAALCPEHRWCLDGCERADSFVFNPHKWLFTPIDASALYTRHPEIFKRAFSLVPEYLTTPVSGQVVDLMDYGVQLGRRFRALKLWWILRCFGLEGVQERIRRHIEMARDSPTGWKTIRTSSGSRRRPSRSSVSAPGRKDWRVKNSTASIWSSWNTSTHPARSSCPTPSSTTGFRCASPSATWRPWSPMSHAAANF